MCLDNEIIYNFVSSKADVAQLAERKLPKL